MSQGVRGNALCDACCPNSRSHRLLHALRDSVPAALVPDRLAGEKKLPAQFTLGGRIFAGEASGKFDDTRSDRQILIMQGRPPGHLAAQMRDNELGHEAEPIFVALPSVDADRAGVKVEILDAEFADYREREVFSDSVLSVQQEPANAAASLKTEPLKTENSPEGSAAGAIAPSQNAKNPERGKDETGRDDQHPKNVP